MQDISGFGLQINLVASNTFPTGIILTQFADDADPFDLPSVQIADTGMGLNGDLVAWRTPNTTKITLSMVPNGIDDKLLGILMRANRVAQGKISARDVITLTSIYPDGSFITLGKGLITDGMPGNSIASSGRMKSKTYGFAFQNDIGV